MAVPTGTAGTPTIGTIYGICADAIAHARTAHIYTITTPVSVPCVHPGLRVVTSTRTACSYTSTNNLRLLFPIESFR